MFIKPVGGDANDLDISLGKVGCPGTSIILSMTSPAPCILQDFDVPPGNFCELSGANRSEISGMREEDSLGPAPNRYRNQSLKRAIRTHESPIHSWNLIGPAVV